jgi:hypothetical protein
VKGGLPPLHLEPVVIAPIIPQPKPEKHDSDGSAVGDHENREFRHALIVMGLVGCAKHPLRPRTQKKRRGISPARHHGYGVNRDRSAREA